MTRHKRFLATSLLLALATIRPAAASDANGRSYTLHTLDYRLAETLVWELCDRNGGKSSSCRVQDAGPHGVTVFAKPEVHAQVVEMLFERDQRTPASVLFEIALVRLEDKGGSGGPKLAPHQQRAIDAIREIFPGKKAEIFDTGLIRTASEGQIQLADESGNLYLAEIRLRSVVGVEKGLEFSIDLSIRHSRQEGTATMLASSLTIAEGETVVAGSSRTSAETAVVVLLTSKEQR